MQRLLIGTYPAGDEAGTGEGIWDARLDLSTGVLSDLRLVAELPSPSFLALHPSGETVLAVTEATEGQITDLRLGPDSLVARTTRPTDGAHPCHVVAGVDGAWVANYSSGTFVAYGVDARGGLTGTHEVFAHEGSGPDPVRQEGPHAHFCLETPDGRFVWLVDLGTDQIRRFRRAEGALAGVLDDGIAVSLPSGSGPRHAVVHPSGTVFVVGELDSRVHTVRTDVATGGGEVVASQSACVTPDPGVGSYPSHVALSPDGTRLYAAVRGPDVLSTFAVEVVDGLARLTHLADSPIGGVWPRHFAVVESPGGDLVVVANQNSSTVAVLRVDAASGAAEVVSSQELPVPACILPV